ncbi:hypothetical protein P8452_09017 [Trifolium repens]|nr:hypothetical protein P8452_09017 [Trifolium repens]
MESADLFHDSLSRFTNWGLIEFTNWGLIDVIVGGKLVMNNFNVNFKHSSNDSNDAIIKEFILKVESNLLEIVFRPVNDSGFGFVNRIEVFSAPEDFVVDYGSRFVGPFGVKEYKNLSLK